MHHSLHSRKVLKPQGLRTKPVYSAKGTGCYTIAKTGIKMKQLKNSVIFHEIPYLPYISAVTGTIIQNEFPLHVHESLCLGMSIKGERIIRSDKLEITIHEGSLFLIPPKTAHSCTTGQNQNHSYKIIVIKPEFLNLVCAETSANKNENPCFAISQVDDIFLKELLEDFFSSLEEGKDELRLSEIAYEIAARLCMEHSFSKKYFHEPVSGESSVKRAVEYLEKKWGQQILLETLGKEAGMSPYHLLRVFRRIMGLTPHAYLLQTRIKKAVEFLSKGMTPADVAAMTGFTDQSHFTKVFRRQVGVTPGLFQENNKS